jgi:hypothetical protein
MSLEIRTVIHFLWLKNFHNPEISQEIGFIYGASVIEPRIIQKWMHRFEESEHSLEDGSKPNRPRSTEYVDTIRALLADNPYLL